MSKVIDIVSELDRFAPSHLAESYDNVGLLIGDYQMQVENILVTLDVTLDVVNEAIAKKANVIVAHHPLIFKGIKKIINQSEVEKCIIKAIKNDISIIAAHTNLDHVIDGVNGKLATVLGLINCKVLQNISDDLFQLSVFVPEKDAMNLLNTLYRAGAGNIGNYENCSFSSQGSGSFKPIKNANPTIGYLDKLEVVEETKVEVLVKKEALRNVLSAMQESHPYEEVAYFLNPILNKNLERGAGMIGELKEPMCEVDFLTSLKDKLPIDFIRHTSFLNRAIRKVAICGGSGSFLLKNAISAQADVFISADFKYHDYFEAENKILIADIGHYETEICTKDLFYEILTKKFSNIVVLISETVTKPYNYI